MGHWGEDTVLALTEDPDAGVPTQQQGSGSGTPLAAPAQAQAPAGPAVPAQGADWQGVSDPDARKTFDLEWMDKLDKSVLNSIDHKHADDPKLQREREGLERKRARDLKNAKTDDDRKKINEAYDQKLGAVDTKIEADRDADVATIDPNRSVTTAEDSNAAKKVSQTRNRTDFMSWATNVFARDDDKDPNVVTERVKKHFLGIRGVPGQGGMLLAEKARDRYVKARTEFEKANPGYTLPSSGSTHQMRDLHQDAKGLGMLGHTLGLSIDFIANDNPNLNVPKGQTQLINEYMIKRFTKDPKDADFKPRTRMPTAEADIELMGKNTNLAFEAAKTGRTPKLQDSKDKNLVTTVEDSWNQMSKTSTNFQSSLAPGRMGELRAARNTHFDLAEKEKALKTATAKVKRSKGADKAAAEAEQTRLQRDVTASKALVQNNLATGFAPWSNELKQENAVASVLNVGSKSEIDAYATARKLFPKMKDDDVAAYAKGSKLPSQADYEAAEAAKKPPPRPLRPGQKPPKPPKPLTPVQQEKQDKKQQAAYRRMLVAEMKKREKAAAEQIEYRSKETTVRNSLLKRLADPKKVFGAGDKQPDGTWKTSKKVSDPAIMQLLENGFISNHEMPKIDVDANGVPLDSNKKPTKRKEVLNAKAAATLAKWGFAPSNFGDTMHFDHVEGYSDAVKGGRRRRENMAEERYKPDEKWVPLIDGMTPGAAPTPVPP